MFLPYGKFLTLVGFSSFLCFLELLFSGHLWSDLGSWCLVCSLRTSLLARVWENFCFFSALLVLPLFGQGSDASSSGFFGSFRLLISGFSLCWIPSLVSDFEVLDFYPSKGLGLGPFFLFLPFLGSFLLGFFPLPDSCCLWVSMRTHGGWFFSWFWHCASWRFVIWLLAVSSDLFSDSSSAPFLEELSPVLLSPVRITVEPDMSQRNDFLSWRIFSRGSRGLQVPWQGQGAAPFWGSRGHCSLLRSIKAHISLKKFTIFLL